MAAISRIKNPTAPGVNAAPAARKTRSTDKRAATVQLSRRRPGLGFAALPPIKPLAIRRQRPASSLNDGSAAAGRRNLVRRVNEGDISISPYARLLTPELKQIDVADDMVRLGAGVTMAAITKAPVLGFLAPVAKSIGGPGVRSAATVGANLFARSPHGDFGVALLALDAVVCIEGPEGLDELDLETFFKSRSQLARGSIVTAVRFRRPMPEDFRFDRFVAALRV